MESEIQENAWLHVAPDTQLLFDEDIDNSAFYSNWQGTFGDNDLQLGARFDDHSEFGTEATGQIAWGMDIYPSLRLWASYGTAFKAPTINELFHPGFDFGSGSLFFSGNPNLNPENSKSSEIGLLYKIANNQKLNFNIHKTKIDNLIEFAGINNQGININKASIEGFELSYHLLSKYWKASGNYSFQQARDDSDDSRLLRRADRKLTLSIYRKLANGANFGSNILALRSPMLASTRIRSPTSDSDRFRWASDLLSVASCDTVAYILT